MKELSMALLAAIDAAEPRLRAISEATAAIPLRADGWSPKQILGHLIDSASNNHQRFVRASLQRSLTFPGYDPDGSVAVQAVQQADWGLLISLWSAYNRYLAYLITNISSAKLDTVCLIGENEPVTLGFIATDYLSHLMEHLRQIGVAEE